MSSSAVSGSPCCGTDGASARSCGAFAAATERGAVGSKPRSRAPGRPAPRARRACRSPTSPPSSPSARRASALRRPLAAIGVVVVCGETGSGKTTQLPKICLAAGRGVAGWIGIPSRAGSRPGAWPPASRASWGRGSAGRSAARSGFARRSAPGTHLKVMTDGILVAEIARDRRLEAYDTLIIDEAHERSLNIDLLLGHLKGLLPRRPELRVIVSSATLDPGRIADFFGGAPVIEVAGRVFPVEVRYAEPESAPEDRSRPCPRRCGRWRRRGREISSPSCRASATSGKRRGFCARIGRSRCCPSTPASITPNRNRIFRPAGRRRVVLATNVAETSITVPRIRFVVDTGLARISRYRFRTKGPAPAGRADRARRCRPAPRAMRTGRAGGCACASTRERTSRAVRGSPPPRSGARTWPPSSCGWPRAGSAVSTTSRSSTRPTGAS